MQNFEYHFKEGYPDLSFWIVKADGWIAKFGSKYGGRTRLFCTLESSLSIRVINQFLAESSNLISIDLARAYYNGILTNMFRNSGMVFAETGQIYRIKDIDQLKEDYLLAKLSGLRQ